ncbi:MAG: WbqC family protein [Fodinibius sp.]|nr:WbqC family protein [Fodinibius sp.]
MSKKVAISQSNYIPWKGYFDMINLVDEFVLYDEVQYTTRDWRNRNRIKTPQGIKWLTIPVSSNHLDAIDEVKIADPEWNAKHWKTMCHVYKKAPFFDYYANDFEQLYQHADQQFLSDINHYFLSSINKLLGIETPISESTDYSSWGNRSERLISICRQAGADIYVSGPAAKVYLDVEMFEQAGISVEWMNYDGYPAYDNSMAILCMPFL